MIDSSMASGPQPGERLFSEAEKMLQDRVRHIQNGVQRLYLCTAAYIEAPASTPESASKSQAAEQASVVRQDVALQEPLTTEPDATPSDMQDMTAEQALQVARQRIQQSALSNEQATKWLEDRGAA